MTRGREPFAGIDDGQALAQAIVDTVREPLLVLDKDLHVVAASRSFYLTFRVERQHTIGRLLFVLGDGQWDIPDLRRLLEKIVPEHGELDGYEVEHEFPVIGHRIMLLNARKVFYEGNNHETILLAIEDITQRRASEVALKELLHQKELLVEEMQHRIANSLQIIASIILMKSRTVKSEETRLHLKDAHERVMSVATVQKYLQPTSHGEATEVAPYLTKLCASLGHSMISGSRPISLEVVAGEGTMSTSHAVSIGLIVTEGVLNALKHAFPLERSTADCRIVVTYAIDSTDWTLAIADNGVGKTMGDDEGQSSAGLGTSIVQALAQQLGARVEVTTGSSGTTLALHYVDPPKQLPQAA